MNYSCFDERTGLYTYFSDHRTHAANGDLPVPKLGGLMAGQIGVPAREAGRDLPSGAKKVGTGWRAKGVVVDCGFAAKAAGLGGLADLAGANLLPFFGGALIGAWFLAPAISKMLDGRR